MTSKKAVKRFKQGMGAVTMGKRKADLMGI